MDDDVDDDVDDDAARVVDRGPYSPRGEARRRSAILYRLQTGECRLKRLNFRIPQSARAMCHRISEYGTSMVRVWYGYGIQE